jgi:DNA-binding response OmpR family regulator
VARILIAEDDPLVASFLEKGLRANGWSVHITDDGREAEQLSLGDDFDLLILDIGLPGREGFEVIQTLRSSGKKLPVLVLTGQPQLRDVVACLDEGADDYMTKPFRFEELLARVKARLRRAGADQPHVLTSGDVALDLRARRATVRGEPIELTAREFALLETFMRHADQVLSREQLLSQIWGYAFDPGTNLVNVYVSALRKKLGQDLIQTVRGYGYRFAG